MSAQEPFASWYKKAAAMTIEGLYFSIRDCREAAQNMRGFDSQAEGRYMDEMGAYIAEMNKRAAK